MNGLDVKTGIHEALTHIVSWPAVPPFKREKCIYRWEIINYGL